MRKSAGWDEGGTPYHVSSANRINTWGFPTSSLPRPREEWRSLQASYPPTGGEGRGVPVLLEGPGGSDGSRMRQGRTRAGPR